MAGHSQVPNRFTFRLFLHGGKATQDEDAKDVEERQEDANAKLEGAVDLQIFRDFVVDNTLEFYKEDPTVTTSKLNVEFKHEMAEDADGLTRELFSKFWESIMPLFFEGSRMFLPRVDPDCTEELFFLLGRIASHGFVLSGYFPVTIAPALFINAFDPSGMQERDLVYSFLLCLTESEQTTVRKCLEGGKIQVDDTLLDVMSRFKVRDLPRDTDGLKTIITRVAKCEIMAKPAFIMSAFKDGMNDSNPDLWGATKAQDIRALYTKLQPRSETILERLRPSPDCEPLTEARDRVYEFLRRWVRDTKDKKKLKLFLRYVTGSDLLLIPTIDVAFNRLSGILRRPIAHTCVGRIDLSTEYQSYAAFSSEFETVLSNEDCYRFTAL